MRGHEMTETVEPPRATGGNQANQAGVGAGNQLNQSGGLTIADIANQAGYSCPIHGAYAFCPGTCDHRQTFDAEHDGGVVGNQANQANQAAAGGGNQANQGGGGNQANQGGGDGNQLNQAGGGGNQANQGGGGNQANQGGGGGNQANQRAARGRDGTGNPLSQSGPGNPPNHP